MQKVIPLFYSILQQDFATYTQILYRLWLFHVCMHENHFARLSKTAVYKLMNFRPQKFGAIFYTNKDSAINTRFQSKWTNILWCFTIVTVPLAAASPIMEPMVLVMFI